jgi:hypothetical protein
MTVIATHFPVPAIPTKLYHQWKWRVVLFFIEFSLCPNVVYLVHLASQSKTGSRYISLKLTEPAAVLVACCLVFVSSCLFVQVIIASSPSRQFWLWICRYEDLRI